MPAKALMIQGTGSGVGKSLLTAALCRIFRQAGHQVLPFKAQNMSNNAYVTQDGGEISRAQAEQAKACGVEPSVLMNPILLKPTTDIGAQVIVLGKTIGAMTAQTYETYKPQLAATIAQALRELMERAEILVIEGAGSPAEINLKANDLVNMHVAQLADARVLLVGDIDKGGVFAQLVGTMELLSEEERRLVRGFLINKFRGDASLLEPGLEWLEARYGVPVIGTIPYLRDVELAEEDSVAEHHRVTYPTNGHLTIEVMALPRMSNFTDVDPLRHEPGVVVRFIDRPSPGPLPDALIIPGSKSTIADLQFLHERGLAAHIRQCVTAGAEVVGICGGFQMLSEQIRDPEHVEAAVSEAPGLGYLPAVVEFRREKTVRQIRAVHVEAGVPVTGYEIHMGQMHVAPGAQTVFTCRRSDDDVLSHADGLQSADGRVWGTHLHGLFEAQPFRRWWINRLRQRRGWPPLPDAPEIPADDVYDRLAATVRPHLKLDLMYHMLERSS